VVVVGGGFAGVEAARAAAKAPVDVILIDKTNHHLFQPLLYQVATAVLSPAEIASPIRQLFKESPQRQRGLGGGHECGCGSKMCDRPKRTLKIQAGATGPYDYLVLATGLRTDYFGHDGWSARAPGLKTLHDATHIRARFFGFLKQRKPNRIRRNGNPFCVS
jgi:NADH dehydrogenase